MRLSRRIYTDFILRNITDTRTETDIRWKCDRFSIQSSRESKNLPTNYVSFTAKTLEN